MQALAFHDGEGRVRPAFVTGLRVATIAGLALAMLVGAFLLGVHAQEAPSSRAAPQAEAASGAKDAARFAYVTPIRVIYPRETIRADMVEARFADALPGGVAASFDDILGKASRATLLPGRLIPLAALGEPEVARNGAAVTLVFRADGLDVRAAGVALQAGAAGERIRARNAASCLVVSGVLQGDGTLSVEAGP